MIKSTEYQFRATYPPDCEIREITVTLRTTRGDDHAFQAAKSRCYKALSSQAGCLPLDFTKFELVSKEEGWFTRK